MKLPKTLTHPTRYRRIAIESRQIKISKEERTQIAGLAQAHIHDCSLDVIDWILTKICDYRAAIKRPETDNVSEREKLNSIKNKLAGLARAFCRSGENNRRRINRDLAKHRMARKSHSLSIERINGMLSDSIDYANNALSKRARDSNEDMAEAFILDIINLWRGLGMPLKWRPAKSITKKSPAYALDRLLLGLMNILQSDVKKIERFDFAKKMPRLLRKYRDSKPNVITGESDDERNRAG